MTWVKISCEDREVLVTEIGRDDKGYGPHAEGFAVLSSKTDLAGSYGPPEVFTEWGFTDPERPVLRDYRYPGWHDGEPDRKPCEHYRFVPDGGDQS